MKKLSVGAVGIAFMFTAGSVWAQAESFVYPQKGQSKEQQQKDEYECYQWAKQQTGVDPMASAPSAPPASAPKGGAVRGAAGGAALGAVGGAIAGDAGKGAAIGAGVGAAGGAIRKRRAARKQADAQEQQQAANQERRTTYQRAFGACMEGRGYTVK
jgi:outer membrane lipoprotein SlyB